MAAGIKTVATNKKARHDFFIEETYETGIALSGTEVKSVRAGKVNLRDSYAQVKDGELFLHNVHISPYEQGNIFNKDPLRSRKLLMHKTEIQKLMGLTTLKGYALVPLSLYLKNGKVKVQLGLARGKKLYDKRQDLKERAVRRETEQTAKISMR